MQNFMKLINPQVVKNTLIPLRLIAAVILGLIGTGVSSAQTAQTLYATNLPAARDNYSGVVGCEFEVGSSNVIVSHLGFFSSNSVSGPGLVVGHNVALFNSTLGSPGVLGQVVVPAGTSADWYTNGFYYMHLDPPLLLSSNTSYAVAGVVSNLDGDLWHDAYIPTWNTYYVGLTATNTRHAVYGAGFGNGVPIVWPPAGLSQNGNNNTYGNISAANIQVGQAYCGVQTTNISISAGTTLTIVGFASGAPPINYLWYSNNIALANQTSSSLVIPNITTNASGSTFYLTATNSLGGEQSANVSVIVTAYPVVLTRQPTNLTVFANYQASFYTTATGTPPIFLQWSGNGVTIPGATSTNYSFYANQTNNGEVYSCLASNFISGVPYTTNTSNAVLTVIPNQALPQEYLHGFSVQAVNNFSGMVGGQFTIGNSPVTVTHLGYYAWPANTTMSGGTSNCTLTVNHRVGIFSSSGSTLLGYVTVPAGSNPVLNGYMWVELNPPLVLAANTTYLLDAETFSGEDNWGNTYVIPDLNPYIASSCDAVYAGAAWPSAGVNGAYAGQMYSAPNMAILAPTNLSAFVTPTNVAQVAGTSLTLTGVAVGSPPVSVQWYQNGTPLSGQTNSTLTFSPLQGTNAGGYSIVATNALTASSATSAVSTVTVYTSPVILSVLPMTYTNISNTNFMTLYAGASPTFSVSVTGVSPFYYQWFSNGVAVAGATGANVTLGNVQVGAFTTYCIVTNIDGSATNLWGASVLADPTNSTGGPAPYPQAVLALNPLGYWRLNEPDDDAGQGNGDGNPGAICHDYAGGNNGIYTNADLSQPGYSPTTDPSDTSALFALYGSGNNSDVNSIEAPDFSTPNGVNAELTVEAWVNPAGGPAANAGIAAKGYFNQEEFSMDCGAPNNGFRFEVRNAAGTAYNANSTVLPAGVEGQWLHLVGVCDQANTNLAFYINGLLATNIFIPALSGITNSSTTPMSIGARASTAAAGYNQQFVGYINDVAVFNQALTPGQVAAQYASVVPFAPIFSPTPQPNASANANSTLTIPVTAVGTPPIGFWWTNVTSHTALATGMTNTAATLNATLNYANVPANWNGDQLGLTVSNAYGMTNAFFTLAIANVNVSRTNIVFAVTNNQLTLSWPADHTGWQLQAQTNLISVGINTNWVNVSGSASTNQVVIPINLTNGCVFYRLVYP
jgi:hypothetical protein